MKKLGFIITTVFLILSVSQAATQRASLVEVGILKKQEINDLQEFVGTVNFDKKSQIASQSSGIVKKITFEVGQKVKKGDILIKIDSDILNAKINASKSAVKMYEVQLRNAKKNYNRYKVLMEKKSIAQKVFDDTKLEYDVANENLISAKANLRELIIQKSKKIIKAPFDGIIVEKTINKEEWLNQGTKIATIVNTNSVEIIFNLPMSFINGLELGSLYDVNISGKTIKAKLFAAIPSGDKLTRTFPVKFKANIKDMFIFDGAQAKVSFAKESKSEAFVINRDAVLKRFNIDVVFAVVENTAKMIPIKPIAFIKDKAAIKGKGLVEGMKLVVKGNERIFPDMPVKIINK